MSVYLLVDPATLHLPTTRQSGADPIKFARQFSRHGLSMAGLPAPWVHRDGFGRLMLMDGVTRAVRIAKWLPGQRMKVEVTLEEPNADYSKLATVGERLP